MHTCGHQKASVRVPQIVEPNLREASRGQVTLEGAIDVVRVDRAAGLGTKHEVPRGLITGGKFQECLYGGL